MGFPPAISDFKVQFNRDFVYGPGLDTVQDNDIQRGLNDAEILFNPDIWGSPTDQNTAYLYVAAHFMVLNIQAAGGLSSKVQGLGVLSKGGGTIESKGVGSANVGFAVPNYVRESPILSQFMRTDYGQKYLQLLTPRLVGNVAVVSGNFPDNSGLAPLPSPLSITTLSLPGGTHSVAYLQSVRVIGGISPLTWAVFSGSLPTGLSLNVNTGLISGTPSVAATYYFEIQVTDGLANTAKMNYQVVIA